MSSPASSRRFNQDLDFAMVPRVFIRNQTRFSPATCTLILNHCSLATGKDGKSNLHGNAKISPIYWEEHTGYSQRQMRNAVEEAGRFGYDVKTGSMDWGGFVERMKHWPREERERTKREPKVSNLHPDCQSQGCSRLRECGSQNVTSPVIAISNRNEISKKPIEDKKKAVRVPAEKPEKQWAKTWAALQSFYPLIVILFLTKLVQSIKNIPSVSDEELAEAIKTAYKPTQRGEGLFLTTVPETVLLMREKVKVGQSGEPPGRKKPGIPSMYSDPNRYKLGD